MFHKLYKQGRRNPQKQNRLKQIQNRVDCKTNSQYYSQLNLINNSNCHIYHNIKVISQCIMASKPISHSMVNITHIYLINQCNKCNHFNQCNLFKQICNIPSKMYKTQYKQCNLYHLYHLYRFNNNNKSYNNSNNKHF